MSSRLDNSLLVRVLEDEGQCSRCEEVFPFVNIVKCREIPQTKGQCALCLKCHQRLHPGCTDAQSVLTPRHYDCWLCADRQGEIICALCTLDDSLQDDILDGVLMCSTCSEQVHKLHKAGHRDHFYPVASRHSIAVMGRVGWHDLPDPRFLEPLPEQPSAPPVQTHVTPSSFPAPKAAHQVSSRHFHLRGHASLPVKNVSSSVRHIVIGGSKSSVTMTTMPRKSPASRQGGRYYRSDQE